MRIPFLTGLLVLIPLSSWMSPEKNEQTSPYQFSSKILEAFRKDTNSSRNDIASYAFSYIGEYQQALAYFDKGREPTQHLKPEDSLRFMGFKPVNAREYILNRASKAQIVIINEAHHNPVHRVFTASLLEELYQSGFRYFGAETLDYRDSTLNQRKYPVLLSGYYTREPQYGNLVREALKLGYRVFPYEAATLEEFSSGKGREIAQARKIQQVLRKDPKAKILIHCGYDHVKEAPLGNSWEKAMAGRVKEFTGIDPFTINQQSWTESSEPAKEDPLYRMVSVKQPSVFVNATGEAFAATTSAGALTDVQVAHPKTIYRHGRPAWLLKEGKCKPYFLKKEELSLGFPCMAMAYQEGEPVDAEDPMQQALPVDVIELRAAAEQKALILPRGRYQLVLKNEQGQQQRFMINN